MQVFNIRAMLPVADESLPGGGEWLETLQRYAVFPHYVPRNMLHCDGLCEVLRGLLRRGLTKFCHLAGEILNT